MPEEREESWEEDVIAINKKIVTDDIWINFIRKTLADERKKIIKAIKKI